MDADSAWMIGTIVAEKGMLSMNADANADISGQGASTAKKTSAQELLGDIMGNSQKTSSGQQFL